MRIGDQIAQRRRALNLTQERLAEQAGVSVETIRKLEQGERDSARMSTLHRLSRALRVPTSALIGSAGPAAARREPDSGELPLLGRGTVMDTEEWTDEAVVAMLRRWRPADRAQAGRVLSGWDQVATLTAERKGPSSATSASPAPPSGDVEEPAPAFGPGPVRVRVPSAARRADLG